MFSSFEILVHVLFLVLKTTPTNTEDCKQGYFGTRCALRCHCRGGDIYCHRGDCKHGCAGDYIGTKCQFLGKIPVHWDPWAAALYDNSTKTCIGKRIGNREVRVGLPVADVVTWTRMVFDRYAFGVKPLMYGVNNYSFVRCGLAYPKRVNRLTLDHNCYSAQLVKSVVLKGPRLWALCSFTYSTDCYTGYWGKICRTRCFRECSGGCDKHSGECKQYRCPAGFRGDICKEACGEGHYGLGCLLSCSPNCEDGKCNHVDGTCERGCTPGYTGSNCTKECSRGTYGKNCAQRCSNCKSDVCSRTDGLCLYGCKIGYQLPDCHKECAAHDFGLHCAFTCSLHCAGQLCDHVTGNCLSCPPGALGPRCDQACPTGKFGLNCTDSCPVNCPELCDVATGHCVDCESAGKAGPKCDQDCPSGRYGLGCRHYCTTHCRGGWASCHPVDGTCKQGCASHFKPPFCTVCLESHHGEHCSMPCSRHCLGGKCLPDTGACLNCTKGRRGETCSLECLPGYHGHNCEEKCNEGCFEGVCDMVTGHCRHCILGREGKFCRNALNDRSDLRSQGDGALGPLLFGFAMVILGMLLVAKVQREEQRKRALLFRRRSSSSSEGDDTSSEADHKGGTADTLKGPDGIQKKPRHLKTDIVVSLASQSESSSSDRKPYSLSTTSSRLTKSSHGSHVDPADVEKFSYTYQDDSSD